VNRRGPSGAPPPHLARIGGAEVDLVPLARSVCARYLLEFPDDVERYGDGAMAWCCHDNQWLLSWAVDDVLGVTDLGAQAGWLARVLHARGFPPARLARNLTLAAELAEQGAFGLDSAAVADSLRSASTTVAELPLPDPPVSG
jgi:hypothetical protein